MEELKIIKYLLARLVSLQTGEPMETVLATARQTAELLVPDTLELDQDQKEKEREKTVVDYLFSLYPTKCPNRGVSTGKCSKDKVRLKKMLKTTSAADIEYSIKRYVNECSEGGTYMKNFSTFLNNLPEYGDEPSVREVKKKESEEYK